MDGKRPTLLPARQKEPARRFSTAARHRYRAFLLCLLLMLSCCGFFLYSALAAPRRSPLIILSATYSPAWDLNPWSQENADLLNQMNRRSLNVHTGGDGTDVANGQWTNLDEHILASTSNRSSMPLLLYINLHGTVNDSGLPCLIPPMADNTDQRSWIGVWELLKHVDQLLNGRKSTVVLLFESGRQSKHVPLASGPTDFATALRLLLEKQRAQLQLENLHILLSSADHLDTVTDWNMGCDLFTRELARGLYGAADRIDHGGNEDGYVQFSELSAFVSKQVTNWSLRHRGIGQSIWAWSYRDANTRLAWKLPGEYKTPASLPAPAGRHIEQLQHLWQFWADLHQRSPWEEFPAHWQTLGIELLGLEQAIYGGQMTRAKVPAMVASIEQRIGWLQQNLNSFQEQQTIEQRVSSAQAATWQNLALSPTPKTAQLFMDQTNSDGSDNLATIPVLQLLAQNSNHSCWTAAFDLKRYSQLRHESTLLQSSAGHSRQAQPTIQWERLRKLEYNIDDSLLANEDPSSVIALLDDYEQALNAWRDVLLYSQQQHKTCNKALASLAEVAECLLSVARIPDFEKDTGLQFSEYHKLEDELVLLCLTIAQLCEQLATNTPVEPRANQPSVHNQIQSLFERQSQLISQLLATDLPPSPTNLARLNCLINHTWHPTKAAVNLGELRSRAWQRMFQWEHLVEEMSSAFVEQSRIKFSNTVAQQPNHEFSRLLAACVAGKSRTSSLSPVEMRNWSSQLQQLGASPAIGDLTIASLQNWHRADMESRLAASLAGVRENSLATATYHELNTAHRLLTYAEETLQSFWNSPRPARPPYFQWLANQALREALASQSRIVERSASAKQYSATTLAASLTEQLNDSDVSTVPGGLEDNAQSLRQRHQQLTKLLRSREAAAVSGFKAMSRWLPDLDNSLTHPERAMSWILEVDVQTGENFSALPAGIANIAVAADAHSSQQAFELDANFKGLQIPISADWLEPTSNTRESTAHATVHFRGHVFHADIPQRPTDGRTVHAAYAHNPNASVTIFDKNPGTQRRTFILDCSASMVDEAVGESNINGGGADKTSSFNKLDAAKLALLDLLRHMRDEGDQVSVILYGHRIAQGTAEQGTLLQTKYLEKFPLSEPLEAYEDVETILPMGRFGDAEFQLVAQRLAEVVPWGQTPLYLALAQSLNAKVRQSNPSDMQAHDIVIISDGRNYQFNPSAEKRVEATQVIQQAQAQQTRVHVIGFGVPADQAEDSFRQFEQLSQGTGGTSTLQIADASLLAQRLSELNAPQAFRVLLVDGSTLTGRANEPLTIPNPTSINEQMAIEYRGKSYFLPRNPGAALSMTVDAQGNLVAINDNDSPLQNENLLDSSGQPTNTWVGIARPQRLGTDVQWQLTLHDHDAHATRRPYRVLIELLPQSREKPTLKKSTPYTVLLNNWSEDTPHPTLRFITTDWPPEAVSASVSVWVVHQASPVDKKLQMEIGSLHWLPRPGIEVRLHEAPSSLTCTVTGQHEDSISDWCLWLDEPAIVAVKSCVYKQTNTSLYHFDLAQTGSPSHGLHLDPLNSSRSKRTVELLSLGEIKRTASTLAQPILVDLAQVQTALAPTAKQR